MFTAVPQNKNYVHIINQIKSAIISGELKVGDPLPTEHEMTEIFNVSRSSVREALKALEVLGLIQSRKGGHSIIVNNILTSLTDSLSLYFILDGGSINNLTQLRQSIELGAVQEVIAHATDEQITRLKACLERYLNGRSLEERQHYDHEFHRTLVSLSGNPLYLYILNSLSILYEKDVFHAHQVVEEQGQLEESREIHQALYSAIAARDFNRAYAALTRHFDFTESDLNLQSKYFFDAPSKS